MAVGDPAHEHATSEPALDRLPPMSALAAAAAVAHLSIARVLLPVLASQKRPLPTPLLVAAPFALNLAACAGMVGFAVSSYTLVRGPALGSMSRRVLVGFLASLVMSTFMLATFAPSAQLSTQQILLATGAVHTMSVQLAMAAIRVQRSLSGRMTAALVATASAFPLLTLLVRQWYPVGLPATGKGMSSLHGLGELAYLLVPIAAAFVVVPWAESPSARRARTLGAIATATMGMLFALAVRLPHGMYGHVLYASLRLEWALEKASLGYAVPVSFAAGAAVAATASRRPASREGGIGLFLWLAGGYNPLTPARLLITALGVSLLCRAVMTADTRRDQAKA